MTRMELAAIELRRRAQAARKVTKAKNPLQVPWDQTIYGVKITLSCPKCSVELPMRNPFEIWKVQPSRQNEIDGTGLRNQDIPEIGWEEILKASTDHRVKGC